MSLSGPGVTASFAYDAVGRRRQKTVNGVITAFLYDGLDVVQELDGSTPVANLLTGLGIDEVLTRTDAVGVQGFLADGLGSTLALTDPAGSVLTEYTYEPFGKTAVTGAASTNAFKYTGREDDGTGLYYYRARYYHPGLQRFFSQDPIGFAGGDVNLYAYVFNDPVNFTDPTGEVGIQCGIGDKPELCRPSFFKRFGKWGRALLLACQLLLGEEGPTPKADPRAKPPPREAPKDPPGKKEK